MPGRCSVVGSSVSSGTRSGRGKLLLAALLVSLAPACARAPEATLPGAGADSGKIVVYRDTWGVAHIYAPTVADGLYAQGYAQAEDRPERLLLNLLMGAGEYATAVGEDGVAVDLRTRSFDHYGTAQRHYPELRAELRSHLEAFAEGINAFYREHPEDVPEWWQGRSVEPEMIVAWSRLFLYNWSIDEAYGDLRRGGVEPGFEPDQRGSNQFAVAPSRSAEGAAILAIDPHLAWHGPSRFWEFRIHAGELEGSGVTLPGSPYIGLGHTRHLAWAMTTGGPDTADVYELALDPNDSTRYRYDGEWRTLLSQDVVIAVRGGEPQTHTLWQSHLGPIVARRDGKAYAARIAYADRANTNEAWYELNFGKDYTAAVRAVETLSMFPQNIMVADTSGNIHYQRAGRVPKRPEGYDWSVPVDGSTSKSDWLGIHRASDHLQVLNPPQGYMQNCNIPPDAMMVKSPFVLEQSIPYLFASLDHGESRDGWTNLRGARAVELLDADDSVTVEEARAYITDIHPYGAERWLEALRRAHEQHGSTYAKHAHYAQAIDTALAWNGELAAGSSAALIYDYWRHQIVADLGEERSSRLAESIDDWYAQVAGRSPRELVLADGDLAELLAAFAHGLETLVANHGSLQATFGDRYRVGRDERSWPVEGGGEAGTTTLRNMSYDAERADKTRWGRGGQTSTQVVVLSQPPRSFIYLPLGESDRPESPHYADQAEKLFSPRQLKPSWWLPEELAEHVESRTVLVRGQSAESPSG